MSFSRRRFLKACLSISGAAILSPQSSNWALEPVNIDNPLGSYPDRDWEKVYLDQYRYDSSFT